MNYKIIATLAGFFFVRALNIVRIISITYKFTVLVMPTLAPVRLWFWQLKGSAL